MIKITNTDKVTVNVNAVDLGNIDLLVSEGFYSNRTDFIKTAIRNQLNTYNSRVNELIIRKNYSVGIIGYSREYLMQYVKENKKVDIKVLGMLVLKNDISAELLLKAINSIKVYGILRCSDEMRSVLISNNIIVK